MDIGTAKPEPALRARIPHHLIDIRDPAESYSAGDFARDVVHVADAIWARGRTPLLVGGTMLYFHALTAGIARLPEADATVRAVIDAEAAHRGWAALHEELARIDPASAERIHVNDPQRIQRALEVFRITGETITELQRARVSAFADVQLIEFAIAPLERRDLHTRIRARFLSMLEAGFLDEVRGLFARGDLRAEHPSMRAVGYRQLWRYLAGSCELNEAIEQAVAATRQLAKRQFTWLRRRENAQWLNSMHPELPSQMIDALSKCGIAGA
jgi:tRNA dimethylallyltransferase